MFHVLRGVCSVGCDVLDINTNAPGVVGANTKSCAVCCYSTVVKAAVAVSIPPFIPSSLRPSAHPCLLPRCMDGVASVPMRFPCFSRAWHERTMSETMPGLIENALEIVAQPAKEPSERPPGLAGQRRLQQAAKRCPSEVKQSGCSLLSLFRPLWTECFLWSTVKRWIACGVPVVQDFALW